MIVNPRDLVRYKRHPGEDEIEAIIARAWTIDIDHKRPFAQQRTQGNRRTGVEMAGLGQTRARLAATARARSKLPRRRRRTWRRHPMRATISPPASVPTAGPRAMPAATAALAVPRLSAGTWRAITLELPGKAMLSPTPSMMRNTSSETKPPTRPISNVLAGPQHDAAGDQPVDGEAVAQPTGEQLDRRVDPEEGRDGQPEFGRGEPELALHQRRRDGDRPAVDIIEENRGAEQQDQRRRRRGAAARFAQSSPCPPPASSDA